MHSLQQHNHQTRWQQQSSLLTYLEQQQCDVGVGSLSPSWCCVHSSAPPRTRNIVPGFATVRWKRRHTTNTHFPLNYLTMVATSTIMAPCFLKDSRGPATIHCYAQMCCMIFSCVTTRVAQPTP